MTLRKILKVVHYDDVEHRVTLTAELPAPMRDGEGRALPRPYAGPRVVVVLDYGPEVGLPVGEGLGQPGRSLRLDLQTI
jgi:hypothetical protein